MDRLAARRDASLVHIDARRVAGLQNRLGPRHFIRRAMAHHEKSVRLDGLLVLDHAVLRNADAEQRGSECAQSTEQDGAFDCSNDHRRQMAQHHHRSDHGNGQEDAAEEQAPEAAPEGAVLAPELDPVPHVVKADHLLLGVEALSDDAVVRHVEAAAGEFSDGLLGVLMAREDGDYGVLVSCCVP